MRKTTLIEMIGKKFGKLTVISRAENSGKITRYNVICECGNHRIVHGSHLRNGHTKACGTNCKASRSDRKRMRDHYLFGRYAAMIRRCKNPQVFAYPYYGGRGIKVCDQWMDFYKFLEDMGEPSNPDMQLDRINNDGDYCPENCRWVTRSENCKNRRQKGSCNV